MKKTGLWILIFTNTIFGQSSIIEWQSAFGGSNIDACRDIEEALDNGAIFIGDTRSNDGDVSNFHGDRDYWIVKTDSSGNIEWESAFGGSDDDFGQSIERTIDGGYIAMGSSRSIDGDVSNPRGTYDIWIIKLNSSGSIEWEKSFGGSLGDFAASIKEIPSGGYIFVGQTNSFDGDVSSNNGDYDFWVVRIDENGTIVWENSYGGSDFDYASDVQPTMDGGFIISGTTLSNDGDVSGFHGERDFWVIKTDSSGNLEWQNALGGSGYDTSLSVTQTFDGSFLVFGETGSYDGDVTHNHIGDDMWLVKLLPSGEIDWQNSYGSDAHDEGFSVSVKQDGNYLISGHAGTGGDVTGNNGNYDYWIATLDPNGAIIWQDSYGGSASEFYANAKETSDGGFIVGGATLSNDGDVSGYHGNYDFWILKLSEPQEITLIPDPNFEQALIDLTIDTDNLINGQVFTSDIENLISLDVSNKNILDLTGIEDFVSLTSLACNSNQIESINLTQNSSLEIIYCGGNLLSAIDISQNTGLKKLYCSNNGLTQLNLNNNPLLEELACYNNPISLLNINQNSNLVYLEVMEAPIMNLDLSQNPNLEILYCYNNQLLGLDLSNNPNLTLVWAHGNQLSNFNVKNGNNNILLELYAQNNPNLNCIQVDDEEAANSGSGVYANWTIDPQASYSENCILAVEEYNIENSIFAFPNPTNKFLYIQVNPKIKSIISTITNISGKIILRSQEKKIDVSALQTGLYFLRIRTEIGTVTKKFIKQ